MATDVERLVLQMSADLRGMEKALNQAQAKTEAATRRIENQFAKMNAKIASDFRKLADAFATALAAVAVTQVARDVADLADEWTNAANKIKTAGVQLGDVWRVQNDLADLAVETNSSYAATVDLFAKLTRASDELGASQAAVRRVTETVNKALQSGGATAGEAKSAILQLSQGLSSGTLAGDELRAIRENSPVLARAIAAEFETTVGGLKKLGAEGALTSDKVFSAILKASREVDAQFAKTNTSIANSFENLRTRIGQYVAEVDRAKQGSATFTGVIRFVSENVRAFADALSVVTALLIGGLAGRAVAAAIVALTATGAAATAATFAVGALNLVLRTLGGWPGLALVGLGAAFAYISTTTSSAAKSQKLYLDGINKANDGARKFTEALDLIVTAQDAERASSIESARAQLNTNKARRDAAVNALFAAQAAAKLATAELQLSQVQEQRLSSYESAKIGGAPNSRASDIRRRIRDIQAAISANAKLAADIDAQVISQEARLEEVLSPPEKKTSTPSSKATENRAQTTIAELERRAAISLAQAADDRRLIGILEDQEEVIRRTSAYKEAGLSQSKALAKAEAEVTAETVKRAELMERAKVEAFAEIKIALAKAAGNQKTADALQRQLDLIREIQRLQNAGFTLDQAQQLATAQADARYSQDQAELQTLRTIEQMERDMENARLAGDERNAAALEKELAILQRIRDLKAQGFNAQAAEAKARLEMATEEEARLRGQFRTVIRDGFKAALDGDLGEFLKNWFADWVSRAMTDALNRIADLLFDLFRRAIERATRRQEDTPSAIISRLFSLGGGGGGGEGISFGGFRAGGGNMLGGRWYMAGERGPEPVYVGSNAFAVGRNVLSAAQKTPAAASLARQPILQARISIDLRGANGDSTIRRIAEDAAARGTQRAVDIVNAGTPSRLRRIELLES